MRRGPRPSPHGSDPAAHRPCPEIRPRFSPGSAQPRIRPSSAQPRDQPRDQPLRPSALRALDERLTRRSVESGIRAGVLLRAQAPRVGIGGKGPEPHVGGGLLGRLLTLGVHRLPLDRRRPHGRPSGRASPEPCTIAPLRATNRCIRARSTRRPEPAAGTNGGAPPGQAAGGVRGSSQAGVPPGIRCRFPATQR